MNDLRNVFRRLAGQMDMQVGQMRKGIVESYNPNNYTARVTIQPEGNLSGWIPIRAVTGGNGWGLVVGLVPGMQVSVEPQEGDPGNLEITGIIFSPQGNVTAPAVPAGEIWMVHQTGSFIKLLTDGSIASQGTWNHAGAFNASAEITAKAGGASVTLTGHDHNQPDDSGGNVEATTTPPNAGT